MRKRVKKIPDTFRGEKIDILEKKLFLVWLTIKIVCCSVLDFIFTNLEFQEIYQTQMKHYFIFERCVYLKTNWQKKKNYMNTVENGIVCGINRYAVYCLETCS